jgi:opacity protein-like surface antigen
MSVGTHSGKLYAVVVRTGVVAGSATVALALLGSSAALAQNCGPLTFPGSNVVGANGPVFTGVSAGMAVSGAISASNTAFLTQSTAFVSAPANPKPDSEGSGIWIRGVGGELTLNSNTQVNANLTVTSVPGNNNPVPPGSFHDSTSCGGQFHQSFGGFQLGYDVAKLNVGGWNLTLGTTAGFLETHGSIVGGNASGIAPGSPFNSTTQAPFVGTYAVATYGNFFIDGLIRADYFQTDLDSPTAFLFNQKVDAHGFTAAASAGYRWDVPNSRWFIEPSAGVIWSREKIDPINTLDSSTFISGTTQLNDIESIMGRIGVRVGTTVESSTIVFQPFAAVSVWHDFAGNVTGNVATCPGCAIVTGPNFPQDPKNFSLASVTASTSTNNIGTFGQYSLGVSAAVKNTGWLGFARVDFREGSEMHGLSATGGIRYQFTPTASALLVKAKAPADYPVNWTGWYAGVVGGATEYGRATQSFGPEVFGSALQSDVMRPAGWLGGGALGYNYQAGKWVVGVEGDLVGTNSAGSTQTAPLSFFSGQNFAIGQTTSHDSLDWIATATARLGYAWTPRSLLYVKAGGAFANEKASTTFNILDLPFFSVSTVRTGWTVGFGSEFALTDRWSIKGELDWLDFGTKALSENLGGNVGIVNFNSSLHIAEGKLGLNYKFWP